MINVTLKDAAFFRFQGDDLPAGGGVFKRGAGARGYAAELDDEVVDLRAPIDRDSAVNILTWDSEGGKLAYRHTASHVLAQAVNTCIRI